MKFFIFLAKDFFVLFEVSGCFRGVGQPWAADATGYGLLEEPFLQVFGVGVYLVEDAELYVGVIFVVK